MRRHRRSQKQPEHGDCAEVLDYLSLAGKGVSKLVGDGYVKVVKKHRPCLAWRINLEWW